WEAYKGGPWWNIFAVWEGGIAIHGALIGAVLTAIVYARIKKVSFWLLADIAAPSLILGQAIGRWGNFMNQEAHGGAISQATCDSFHQYLPEFIMNQMCIDGIIFYPTFLYYSVCSIMFIMFLFVFLGLYFVDSVYCWVYVFSFFFICIRLEYYRTYFINCT